MHLCVVASFVPENQKLTWNHNSSIEIVGLNDNITCLSQSISYSYTNRDFR